MKQPENINWQELGFTFTATKSMYVARCEQNGNWQGALEPFGDIPLSPAACVLNYGQGLFEGLKAYRASDGNKVYLFRPQENARRLRTGCERICIPPIEEEMFLEAVTSVTQANKDYIPPYQENSLSQGALYLRPVAWGTGPILGVAPAPSYTFVVYASPVGPYFKSGFQPIKLKITKEYHRAAPGGTGAVKAISNYVGGMLPARMAKQEGFQEILYLDARHQKYIEEVGAANFFCIKKNTLFSPELDGCILPGITRRSIHALAKELGLQVEERKISVDEVLAADEAFASGTGAVITPIGSISWEEKEYKIGNGEVGTLSRKLYEKLLAIQHGVDPDPNGWRQEISLN